MLEIIETSLIFSIYPTSLCIIVSFRPPACLEGVFFMGSRGETAVQRHARPRTKPLGTPRGTIRRETSVHMSMFSHDQQIIASMCAIVFGILGWWMFGQYKLACTQ